MGFSRNSRGFSRGFLLEGFLGPIPRLGQTSGLVTWPSNGKIQQVSRKQKFQQFFNQSIETIISPWYLHDISMISPWYLHFGRPLYLGISWYFHSNPLRPLYPHGKKRQKPRYASHRGWQDGQALRPSPVADEREGACAVTRNGPRGQIHWSCEFSRRLSFFAPSINPEISTHVVIDQPYIICYMYILYIYIDLNIFPSIMCH